MTDVHLNAKKNATKILFNIYWKKYTKPRTLKCYIEATDLELWMLSLWKRFIIKRPAQALQMTWFISSD